MAPFGEDFLKSIGESAQSAAEAATQSAADFFAGSVKDMFVRIGPRPGGNSTAEEIAQGQTGSRSDLAISPSKAPMDSIRRAGSVAEQFVSANPFLVFGGGAVLAYLLLKRR